MLQLRRGRFRTHSAVAAFARTRVFPVSDRTLASAATKEMTSLDSEIKSDRPQARGSQLGPGIESQP